MDGSCFVSCGCQNPTLTIMALAVRSTDYLLGEMKKGVSDGRREEDWPPGCDADTLGSIGVAFALPGLPEGHPMPAHLADQAKVTQAQRKAAAAQWKPRSSALTSSRP